MLPLARMTMPGINFAVSPLLATTASRQLPTAGKLAPTINWSTVDSRFFRTSTALSSQNVLGRFKALVSTQQSEKTRAQARVVFLDSSGINIRGKELDELRASLPSKNDAIDLEKRTDKGLYFVDTNGNEIKDLTHMQWEGAFITAKRMNDPKMVLQLIGKYWLDIGKSINDLLIGPRSVLCAIINTFDFGKDTGAILSALLTNGAKFKPEEYHVGPLVDLIKRDGDSLGKKVSVIEALCFHGYDVNTPFHGRTALDFALDLGGDEGHEIIRLLVDRGAKRFFFLKE